MIKEKGFSMIELLISTVIFSMGVLSLAQVFILGVNTIHKSKFQIRATNLAREMMEEIQSKAFDETMVGLDPSAQQIPTSFTNYAVSEDTTSGFPLDAGEPNGLRSAFDDIDDYANYTESPVIMDQRFESEVSVVYAQDSNLNGPASTTRTNFKRITIMVKSLNSKKSARLSSVVYYRGM
jgi:prepilin-type N-terminal cleavage/methylation domain-containing protein